MASKKYDTAVLTLPTGEVRRLSADEFEALPLLERVRAVVKGQVKFLRLGKEIPATEAVKH